MADRSGQPAQPAIKSMSYEQAQAELESLIARIESGEVGLEQAMTDYERGAKLVEHCRALLDQTEQKFIELSGKMKQTDDAGR